MNNYITSGTWTDAKVDELKRLWAGGYSASQCAARLGGMTRSSVIGKVHRLGLAGRATTSRMKSHRPRVRPVSREKRNMSPTGGKRNPFFTFGNGATASIRQDGLPLPTPGAEDVARVSFLDLEPQRHCRFPCWAAEVPPVGDPAFCGATPIPGLVYCEVHARRAYQPPQARQREVNVVAMRPERETEAA